MAGFEHEAPWIGSVLSLFTGLAYSHHSLVWRCHCSIKTATPSSKTAS
ncbi:hypothetical protein JCM19231_3438 [Vibrio ishigakensis]|uniref:Uncharacterized protein n=1 Tax=Vibrio ishigakensis TaxID=1481914 RepID=A0A0B8NYZ1_9VIBR|nr:hypothetical protein JCM19231_3438 [Vibrio ishigakensis]